jgi:excisionase family DNA binding protein
MNQNLENVLLTVNEIAKTLKTNSNTVYELLIEGSLKD